MPIPFGERFGLPVGIGKMPAAYKACRGFWNKKTRPGVVAETGRCMVGAIKKALSDSGHTSPLVLLAGATGIRF